MTPQKYLENWIFTDKPDLKQPPWEHLTNPEFTRRMAYIDDETVPGAEFGCETMWLLPGDTSPEGQRIMDAHTLPHGVFIAFFGYNYDDVQDLGAEVEFWIGGEKQVVTKSFASFIPAGLEHGPLIIRHIQRPIFHFIAQPTRTGDAK